MKVKEAEEEPFDMEGYLLDGAPEDYICPLSLFLFEDAVIAQDAGEQIDVRQIGHVLEREPVRGEQARDQQWQRRVLGAGDRDCTHEPLPTGYANAIHFFPLAP